MRTIILCLFLLLQLAAKAQDTIPFQLNSAGNIVLSALLNGTDSAQLMLHTAAQDLSLIQGASPRLPSVHFLEKDSIESWGGGNETRFSHSNSLSIGQQVFSELTIWENLRSGPETDGKMGINLLRKKVVSINFRQQQLILYDTLPTLPDSYERLPLRIEDDFLFLQGLLLVGTDTFSQDFLIHSGYAGAMLLDDAFVETNQLGERLPIISEEILRDAYGNVIKSQQVKLPTFILGSAALSELTAAFFAGNIGRHKVSLLGMATIRQFNWVFDWEKQVVYLERC